MYNNILSKEHLKLFVQDNVWYISFQSKTCRFMQSQVVFLKVDIKVLVNCMSYIIKVSSNGYEGKGWCNGVLPETTIIQGAK